MLDVLHIGVDAVEGVLHRNGEVRGGLDAYDSLLLGKCFDNIVGYHSSRWGECAGATVTQGDGFLAEVDGVEHCLWAHMGCVDEHSKLVHSDHAVVAEVGQTPVAQLLEPRAEHIRLAVVDSHAAD